MAKTCNCCSKVLLYNREIDDVGPGSSEVMMVEIVRMAFTCMMRALMAKSASWSRCTGSAATPRCRARAMSSPTMRS